MMLSSVLADEALDKQKVAGSNWQDTWHEALAALAPVEGTLAALGGTAHPVFVEVQLAAARTRMRVACELSKREGVDPGAFSRRLLAHAVTERRPADEAVAKAREAVKDDALCKKGGSMKVRRAGCSRRW